MDSVKRKLERLDGKSKVHLSPALSLRKGRQAGFLIPNADRLLSSHFSYQLSPQVSLRTRFQSALALRVTVIC